MGKFKYVFVPADESAPVEEKTMTYAKKKDEVGCMSAQLQKHFSTGKLTAEQSASLKAQITSQMKQKTEISDTMLDLMSQTETIDIVALFPPKTDNKFVGINMYCDDKGVVKNLGVNRRASEITALCGKPTQVHGDAFFGRVLDDGRDLFERQDFTLRDLQGDAPWVIQARGFNSSQQENASSNASELKTMLETGGLRKQKGPVTAAAKATYKKKLEAWAAGKLKQYDSDETFRKQRDAKYQDRAGFEQFLRAQQKEKMIAETVEA